MDIRLKSLHLEVTPFAGVGIEMEASAGSLPGPKVTPFAGGDNYENSNTK